MTLAVIYDFTNMKLQDRMCNGSSPSRGYPCDAKILRVFIFWAGQLYGLEKFWAFLKYTRKQNIVVDAKLTGFLSKFKRLEDFRVQEVNKCNLWAVIVDKTMCSLYSSLFCMRKVQKYCMAAILRNLWWICNNENHQLQICMPFCLFHQLDST